jgi:hypothetical protein
MEINMSKDVSFDYSDRCVSVSSETWDDLIRVGTHIAFSGIVAGVREVIAQGGHFMIIAEDGTSISRRIDRIGEFDDLVDEAKKMRSKHQQ